MRPTFVVALPRCRTAWLANFFYYGPCVGLHEPLATFSNLDDFESSLRKIPAQSVLVADTAFPFIINQMMRRFNNLQFIVLHETPRHVRESLQNSGISVEGFDRVVKQYGRAVEIARASPFATLFTTPADFDSEETMREIWNFVTDAGDRFPWPRYRLLRDMNVQVMRSRVEDRVRDNAAGIAQLAQSFED